MPSRLHLEIFGPIHALPILHYRLEFAHLVRQAVRQVRPDCIAVELPSTLEERFTQAVGRLPQVSVISYESTPSPSSKTAARKTIYLLVEPADPLAEAARCALEQAIPLHLVDVDLDDYPAVKEFLPDSYAIQRIGLADYYHEYLRATAGAAPCRDDLRREQGMAFRLQRLAQRHERILFVGGMAHVGRIREFYGQPRSEPLGRTRRTNVRIFSLHPESCGEVMGEFPFVSAIYEMRRSGLPPERGGTTPPLRRPGPLVPRVGDKGRDPADGCPGLFAGYPCGLFGGPAAAQRLQTHRGRNGEENHLHPPGEPVSSRTEANQGDASFVRARQAGDRKGLYLVAGGVDKKTPQKHSNLGGLLIYRSKTGYPNGLRRMMVWSRRGPTETSTIWQPANSSRRLT